LPHRRSEYPTSSSTWPSSCEVTDWWCL